MLVNINPALWGKPYWDMMHYVTLAYPENPLEDDKQNINDFFSSINNVIPCHTCRANFKDHLKKYPLDEHALLSRNNLIQWLVNIHNEVNRLTHKPNITQQDVEKQYLYSTKPQSYTTLITIILLILLVIIIIIYVKYR
jgi:hypothetical protein